MKKILPIAGIAALLAVISSVVVAHHRKNVTPATCY